MFDELIDSVCAAERHIGFPASVYCSGLPRSVFRPSVAAVVAQAEDVCTAAKEVVLDETVAPPHRVAAWRGRLLARGVTNVEIGAAVRRAVETDEGDAAGRLAAELRSVIGTDWTCEAVGLLLRERAANDGD